MNSSKNKSHENLLYMPTKHGRRFEGGLRTKGFTKQTCADNPLITVIIAVYNGEQYLEECIVSILGQTYKNFEIIIIDGRSLDNSVNIIIKYEDKIDYWVSELDRGIYDAWNKALMLANGDWIVFYGSDDIARETAFKVYVENILTLPSKPNLLLSRVQLVNNDKKPLRLWGAPYKLSEFRRHMKIAHVGALHHRSLFDKFGLFDTSYKSAGDYEFFMRCGRGLRTLFIDTITADVLVGGVSMNNSIGLLEACNIQKKYGMNPIIANYYYYVALLKQKMRPLVRGY